MIFLIIACIIFLILSWLLLSPLIINLDTRIPVLEAKWKNIGSLSLLLIDDKWMIKFRILFYSKVLSFSSLKKNKKVPKKKKVNNKVNSKKSFIKVATAVKRILFSFRTRQLYISLDTGDYALNGFLYTLNASSAINKHVSVNFENRNFALLQISNTPLRMILAYLNIFFKI